MRRLLPISTAAVLLALIGAGGAVTVRAMGRAASFHDAAATLERSWTRDVTEGVPQTSVAPLRKDLSGSKYMHASSWSPLLVARRWHRVHHDHASRHDESVDVGHGGVALARRGCDDRLEHDGIAIRIVRSRCGLQRRRPGGRRSSMLPRPPRRSMHLQPAGPTPSPRRARPRRLMRSRSQPVGTAGSRRWWPRRSSGFQSLVAITSIPVQCRH